MTHRKHSKYLSLLLSAVLVLTMIHKWWIPSVADDPAPITRDGITYVYDGEIGHNVFWINPDNADSVSGNDITVPGGCGLNILDTDFAIDSIAVEDGGIVEISTDQASSATLTANISLSSTLQILTSGWSLTFCRSSSVRRSFVIFIMRFAAWASSYASSTLFLTFFFTL